MFRRFVGILLISGALLAAPPPIYYEPPIYPVIARYANVEGTVTLEFSTGNDGIPYGVEVMKGPGLLVLSAKTNLLMWRFPGTDSDSQRLRANYEFYLAGPASSTLSFQSDSFTIRVRPPCNKLDAASFPNPDQNFVALSREGYSVTVFEDGRIKGTGSAAEDELQYQISPEDARQLVQKFGSTEVLNYCPDNHMVLDGGSVGTKISVNGQQRAFEEYPGYVRDWFAALQDEIDSVANTHHLRHGDPATEPLWNITEEYFSKPGLTDLMRAAIHGRVPVQMLIASGVPIDEVDSSGWTALMYAAASHYGYATDLLFQFGADLKHVSPYGDTVLMADALDGTVDLDWKSAGNVNSQNRDGVTALMLLANRAEPDEIKAALKAGADATVRDNQGHMALDYLETTQCGHTLVRGEKHWMWITRDPPCPFKGDAAKSRKLLQNAMKRKR